MPDSKVIAIVLTDQNNAIGKNHIMLDYLPAYIDYFEQLTRDSPLIMGRLTFESIAHTLHNKKKIVVTRSEKYHSSKARTFATFHQALEACRNKKEKKIFVIGGAEVFKQSMPYTREIYRIAVKARFRANDYFPEIDEYEFQLEFAECISADMKNRFDYCIEKWVRKDDGKSKKK